MLTNNELYLCLLQTLSEPSICTYLLLLPENNASKLQVLSWAELQSHTVDNALLSTGCIWTVQAESSVACMSKSISSKAVSSVDFC